MSERNRSLHLPTVAGVVVLVSGVVWWYQRKKAEGEEIDPKVVEELAKMAAVIGSKKGPGQKELKFTVAQIKALVDAVAKSGLPEDVQGEMQNLLKQVANDQDKRSQAEIDEDERLEAEKELRRRLDANVHDTIKQNMEFRRLAYPGRSPDFWASERDRDVSRSPRQVEPAEDDWGDALWQDDLDAKSKRRKRKSGSRRSRKSRRPRRSRRRR